MGATGIRSIQICFNDSQKLEFVRHELSACAAIINSSMQTAKDCIEFCESIREAPDIKKAIRAKFANYIGRMQSHARTTELLLEQSKDTASLVSNMEY